jgi:16S rRNA (guanine1207-N2)-methyltransferase
VSEHYFSATPQVASQPFEIEVRVLGHALSLVSDRGVFSSQRLDTGSRLLAETVQPEPGETVLDLGCGLGILGIVAGLSGAGGTILLDRNERAASLAGENLRRAELAGSSLAICADGADALVDASVDLVLLNPPIRAGRGVVHGLIRDAARVLRSGGRLALVALTRQGAESLARIMAEEIAPPELAARGSGYRVFVSRKA